MTLLGLFRWKQIFCTPKIDQIFDDPKQTSLNYHFWEMTPGYPSLWDWCSKIVETSKTCKILLYFGLFLTFKYLCPIRTKSSKYVHFFYLGPIPTNESQRALNVQNLPQTTLLGLSRCKQIIFTPKVDQKFWWPQIKFARCQKLSFLRNDPRLPHFMSWI